MPGPRLAPTPLLEEDTLITNNACYSMITIIKRGTKILSTVLNEATGIKKLREGRIIFFFKDSVAYGVLKVQKYYN